MGVRLCVRAFASTAAASAKMTALRCRVSRRTLLSLSAEPNAGDELNPVYRFGHVVVRARFRARAPIGGASREVIITTGSSLEPGLALIL